MDTLLDGKFYQDAMSSVFSCHLSRADCDIPKPPQRKLVDAKLCASKIPSENQNKGCCEGFELETNIVPVPERPVNAEFLHCTARHPYVPEPMHGWTSGEQLALIAAVKAVPSEHALMVEHCCWTKQMAHHQYLLRISQQVRSKSADECERCLKHLHAKRVAYFGQHHLHDQHG